MPLAQYSFRRSVLEDRRTYTLHPDRLDVEGGGHPLETYPLDSIRRVQLKYEHTKQREYYLCILYTIHGRLVLRHVDYQSFGKFENRAATYTPFVKALLAQLAQQPYIRFQGGSTVNFIAAILGVPLMGGLGYLAAQLGHIEISIFAVVMMALSAVMIRPSKPRRFDPLAPPKDLLPSVRR